jgi:hypothetical protein
MAGTITWDQSAFDAAFGRYVQQARHGWVDATNKKGYYVARKAIWFSHQASALDIDADVGTTAWTIRLSRRGKRKGKMWRHKRMFKSARISGEKKVDVPLVAAIINARRGRRGEPGLQGREMQAYAQRLWGNRKRSIAFIKSGFMEARDTLQKHFRKGRGTNKTMPSDRGIKRYGVAKGAGTPASLRANVMIAKIENKAIARHDRKGSLERYGGEALQRAFNDEAADMERYLAREMQVDIDVANKELK